MNYDPGMPPTFRCDADEGTNPGTNAEMRGHGPFGLRQGRGGGGNNTRW